MTISQNKIARCKSYRFYNIVVEWMRIKNRIKEDKNTICQICNIREEVDSSRVIFVYTALNSERGKRSGKYKNAKKKYCYASNFVAEWTELITVLL